MSTSGALYLSATRRQLETFKAAIEQGRADGATVSDKNAVLAMYERCKAFHIPTSNPPAKPAPPTPTPPPNPAGPPPKPKSQSLDEVLADASKTPGAIPKSGTRPSPRTKLTQSEEWAVVQKIRPCWGPPLGGAEKIAVEIAFSVGRDGRVVEAKIVDLARMHDKYYAAAANAALRAVLNPRCQPWPLPPEIIETLRDGRLTLDPRFF